MKRKLSAFLLSLIMILSLSACASSTSSTENSHNMQKDISETTASDSSSVTVTSASSNSDPVSDVEPEDSSAEETSVPEESDDNSSDAASTSGVVVSHRSATDNSDSEPTITADTDPANETEEHSEYWLDIDDDMKADVLAAVTDYVSEYYDGLLCYNIYFDADNWLNVDFWSDFNVWQEGNGLSSIAYSALNGDSDSVDDWNGVVDELYSVDLDLLSICYDLGWDDASVIVAVIDDDEIDENGNYDTDYGILIIINGYITWDLVNPDQ